MKRLLTYGLLLLTILASHFVVSACQDDLPETTEVMMTFTTRAVMGEASTAPDNERMQDLRVIMLRENGTVVDNHMEEDINASSVTFTFTTPIQTGGEDFTFLAVANEGSIQSESESKLSWLSCSPGDKLTAETITQIKAQKIGNGSAFDINKGPIPQTKQWTVTVPQASTHVENQQLDFVASKISVKFQNHTVEPQKLSGIKITGIGSATDGYLFAQASNDFGTQQNPSDIAFEDVTVHAGESSVIQYYTYPVPVSSVSSPTLYATWNGKEYNLPIKINEAFISSLPRNQHLQIVVTLTGEGMMYHVVNWEENPTNIGSPTPEGGYQVDGWGNGNNIIIGGETGEEPEEPGGGDTPVIPGDVIWEGSKVIGWQSDRFELTDARIKNSSSICIVIDVKGNAHGQIQLQGYIPGYFNITNLTQGETDKHIIIKTTQNNAVPDGSFILEGSGVILKKIYIPITSE